MNFGLAPTSPAVWSSALAPAAVVGQKATTSPWRHAIAGPGCSPGHFRGCSDASCFQFRNNAITHSPRRPESTRSATCHKELLLAVNQYLCAMCNKVLNICNKRLLVIVSFVLHDLEFRKNKKNRNPNSDNGSDISEQLSEQLSELPELFSLQFS